MRPPTTGIGSPGQRTGSDNIDTANAGKAGESKAIRIGTKGTQNRTFIAGISGKTIDGTVQPVLINEKGQPGTASSASASTASLAATVERLEAQVERQRSENAHQQGQIARLREQLQRGG